MGVCEGSGKSGRWLGGESGRGDKIGMGGEGVDVDLGNFKADCCPCGFPVIGNPYNIMIMW